VNKWNKLEDKKPTKKQWNYIISDGKNTSSGFWNGYEFMAYENYFMDNVKYWMPFPKPPEKE
jgi:hypothetical protein